MDDRKLVADFLNTRSEGAFRKLYHSKTPHLYKTALRLTQDEELSCEIIQQMWVVAIRKLEGFEWRSELKTWLIAILFNRYRTIRKEQERSIELAPHHIGSESAFEEAMDLEAAISQLPPGYRQVMILHDLEGYKHREIAEILDISEGTSKSQLFYARKAMREYLSDSNSKIEQ